MNEPQDALSRRDIDRLATYNAEVYRGIVHTEEYANEMARLQRSFNDTQIAWRSESEYVAPGNSEGCAAPAQVSDRKVKLEIWRKRETDSFAERPTPSARPGESCGDDPHVRLDSWLSRLMGFFRSPTHAEVVEAFEQRGFSRLDAEHAATDLRLSCRQGRPTPKWIMGKLAGTAYPDQPVPDIEMHA